MQSRVFYVNGSADRRIIGESLPNFTPHLNSTRKEYIDQAQI